MELNLLIEFVVQKVWSVKGDVCGGVGVCVCVCVADDLAHFNLLEREDVVKTIIIVYLSLITAC